MRTLQHQLVKQLSQTLGKHISVKQGAVIIGLDDEEIYLEFPEGESMYIIHKPICPISSLGVSYSMLETILMLNSRLDLLHCGWLGLHKRSNSLRYFITVPVHIASVDMLLEIIKSLPSVKKQIITSLNI